MLMETHLLQNVDSWIQNDDKLPCTLFSIQWICIKHLHILYIYIDQGLCQVPRSKEVCIRKSGSSVQFQNGFGTKDQNDWTMQWHSMMHTSFDLGILQKPSSMHLQTMCKCFIQIHWILNNVHGSLSSFCNQLSTFWRRWVSMSIV